MAEAGHIAFVLLLHVLIFELVVQELGREGVLLFSSFFSSNKPFNTPMAGIGCQWFTSAAVMLAAPPGDAYLFLLNRTSTLSALPLSPFTLEDSLAYPKWRIQHPHREWATHDSPCAASV